jgi:hypothetical protein
MIAGLLAGGAVVATLAHRRRGDRSSAGRWLMPLVLLGSLQVMLLLYLAVVEHLRFPFTLDVMEFAVLQHVTEWVAGHPIYPAGGPAFVPLAYNPLYYVICAPFVAAFGPSLQVLRCLALVAMLGLLVANFIIVRRETASPAWGAIAAGLFAAAYRAMDGYLDSAHSDGWLVLSALLGAWWLDRDRTTRGRLGGVALLCAGFWFKQHGAVFVVGGLIWLLFTCGVVRTLPALLLAFVLGPLLYLLGGPTLFGPEFHYYTWTVPAAWSRPGWDAPVRLAGFVLTWYAVPAALAAWRWARLWRDRGPRMGALDFLLPFAVLTGLMGTLDPGSADNIFIAMGTWLLLTGTMALHDLGRLAPAGRTIGATVMAAFVAFAALAYDPRPYLTDRDAPEVYRAWIEQLRALPGTVSAPWVGQLPADFVFVPAPHWVALDDLAREPADMRVAGILGPWGPALDPPGPAWVIANARIERFRATELLAERYVLHEDWGDRYRALRCAPRRYPHGWPRYLYRHVGRGTAPATDPAPTPSP